MNYRKIEKQLTEKSLNLVKDKIKALATDAIKQFKRQKISVPKATPDEESLFPLHLGKYVKQKNIPLVIQEAIRGKIREDEIELYNNVYIDYMRNRRRLGVLDERVETHTQQLHISYDRNDVPLSKLKYRLAEVKEDFTVLANRHKQRASLNNLPIYGTDKPDFGPIERKGRSSLVPFRLSFGSNLSGSMSEKAQKRSGLMNEFDTLNRESNLFKNSNLDFAQVLDFFQGGNSTRGSALEGFSQNKVPDFPQLPSFN